MMKQRGLTLVELMVVVAVMAVIAAIAYPLYTAQSQKARRADAKTALEQIALAQERYYTVSNRYAATLASLQITAALAGGASDKGYYTIAGPTITSAGQAYSVTATASSSGAQSGDAGKCGSFTIDHRGGKTATGSAADKCW